MRLTDSVRLIFQVIEDWIEVKDKKLDLIWWKNDAKKLKKSVKSRKYLRRSFKWCRNFKKSLLTDLKNSKHPLNDAKI